MFDPQGAQSGRIEWTTLHLAGHPRTGLCVRDCLTWCMNEREKTLREKGGDTFVIQTAT